MFKRALIFLDRLHWLWLALAAPFLLFPSPKRSLAMLVVPMLFLLHWLALKGKQQTVPKDTQPANFNQQSAIPCTPLNGALLLMMLMVLVSLWATFDINYSLPKISGMVLGIGVFFAVAREGARPRGWINSLLVFLGIGLGIAILGVFGTSWVTNKFALFSRIIAHLPRLITGLQGAETGLRPAEIAGALIWVLPLMVAICFALFFLPHSPKNETTSALSNNWQKKIRGWRLVGVIILFLAATLFITAVLLLSQSRAGYIGLALTLPVLILIALPSRWRRYSTAILIVLAIVLGILLALQWGQVRAWIAGSDMASDPTLSLNSLEGRLEIWSRALYGIQDFPLTGMGMNTFRKVMPELYPLFNFSPDMDIGHAHNEFLQAALDLGIPGLIAFLALYIGTFWMLVEVWRTTRQPPLNTWQWSPVTRLLVLGLGGALFAHLLFGMTDAVALGAKPGMLFWMLLGLVAGLYQQAQVHWTVLNSDVPPSAVQNGSRA